MIGKNIKMDIFFTVNDAYMKHLSVCILSILKNSNDTDDFNFYILNTNVTEASKKQMELLKDVKEFNIEYIDVDVSFFNKCKKSAQAHISIDTNFRFLASTVKPDLEKAIFLDADLVVLKSLRELWAIDITDYCMACCIDPKSNHLCKTQKLYTNGQYFNTGVSLLNLKKWREENIEDKLFCAAKQHEKVLELPDQDCMNIVMNGKIKKVNSKFNCMPVLKEYGLYENKEELADAFSDPFIVHYAADRKPWDFVDVSLAHHYWTYADSSPFYAQIRHKVQGNKKLVIVGTQTWFPETIDFFKDNGFQLFVVYKDTRWAANLNIFKEMGAELFLYTGDNIDEIAWCINLDCNTVILGGQQYGGVKFISGPAGAIDLEIYYKLTQFAKHHKRQSFNVKPFIGDTGFDSEYHVKYVADRIIHTDVFIFSNSGLRELICKHIPKVEEIPFCYGSVDSPLLKYVFENSSLEVDYKFLCLGRNICSKNVFENVPIVHFPLADSLDCNGRSNYALANVLDCFKANDKSDLSDIVFDRELFYKTYHRIPFGLSHLYDIFHIPVSQFIEKKDFYFTLEGQQIKNVKFENDSSYFEHSKRLGGSTIDENFNSIYYPYTNVCSKEYTYLMFGLIPIVSHVEHDFYKYLVDQKMAIVINCEDDLKQCLNISKEQIIAYRKNIFKNKDFFTFDRIGRYIIEAMEEKRRCNQPKISFILPNFNNEHVLDLFFSKFCENNTYSNYEFIVVDDGSYDESLLYLNKWKSSGLIKDMKVIERKHEGIVPALNCALAEASGKFIVRMDGDATVETKGFVELFLEFYNINPEKIGVVTSKVVADQGWLHAAGRTVLTPSGLGDNLKMPIEPIGSRTFDDRTGPIYDVDTAQQYAQEVDTALGVCTFSDRQTALAIGGFDKNYPLWIEDDDFYLSYRLHGKKVFYIPEVYICHRFSLRGNRNPSAWKNKPTDQVSHDKEWRANILKHNYKHWQNKWNFDPLNPNIDDIQKNYANSELVWRYNYENKLAGEVIVQQWQRMHPPHIEKSYEKIINNGIKMPEFLGECSNRPASDIVFKRPKYSYFQKILRVFMPDIVDADLLRCSYAFDVVYYLKNNRDVARDGIDPILHYVKFGSKEGRNPAPWFSTFQYMQKNGDVASSRINPFLHYLQYGHIEGRLSK